MTNKKIVFRQIDQKLLLKIKIFNGCITTAQINQMLAEFYQVQALYQKTGGVHTSAVSDGRQIVIVAEDIGRHNTLDKLQVGAFLNSYPYPGVSY